MKSIYAIFDDVAEGSEHLLSSRTLASIRDYYMGYTIGADEGHFALDEGDPPFTQFAQWLARRYGKSKKSLYNRWTRYDGGWWRIIAEQFGSGELGFNMLLELLTEFRQSRLIVVGKTLELSDLSIFEKDSPKALEVLYAPNDGYYMNFLWGDGRTKIEGFYSTLEDLLSAANDHYKVTMDRWQFLPEAG